MATKGRTPIPKSQKEISNGFVDPYDASRGNPNSTQDFNRGNKVSLKGDTVKPLERVKNIFTRSKECVVF